MVANAPELSLGDKNIETAGLVKVFKWADSVRRIDLGKPSSVKHEDILLRKSNTSRMKFNSDSPSAFILSLNIKHVLLFNYYSTSLESLVLKLSSVV